MTILPQNNETFNALLEDYALKQGLSAFGVANIKKIKQDFLLPQEVLAPLDFAISIGYRLSSAVLDTLTDGPNQLYYFHYRRVNVLLDTVALQITSIIQSKGYKALPIPASQVVDWKNQKGHVSHRKIAALAGLGSIGINNLLVHPVFGSQLRLASILTNMPLKPASPGNGDVSPRPSPALPGQERALDNRGDPTPPARVGKFAVCSSCMKCISACPAGAIGKRHDDFNKELCRAKLREFQKTRNIGQMICGMCLRACPGTFYFRESSIQSR